MNGGTITLGYSGTPVFNAPLNGSFTLAANAASAPLYVNGNGAQTSANLITINSSNAPILSLGSGSASGDVGAATITNNGTVQYWRSGGATVANNVSGSGVVAFKGAGASFALTGYLTHSGATRFYPVLAAAR